MVDPAQPDRRRKDQLSEERDEGLARKLHITFVRPSKERSRDHAEDAPAQKVRDWHAARQWTSAEPGPVMQPIRHRRLHQQVEQAAEKTTRYNCPGAGNPA